MFKFNRAGQQISAAGMSSQRTLQQTVVQTIDALDNVLDRVFRNNIQPDVSIPQSQVEVDNNGRVFVFDGKGSPGINGQGCAADSTRDAGNCDNRATARIALCTTTPQRYAQTIKGSDEIFKLDRKSTRLNSSHT